MSKTIPIIPSWSYSRLSIFEQCKFRAKLAYVDRIPEPERPLPPGKTEHANDRGTRIHTAAEMYVQGKGEIITEMEKFRPEFEALKRLYEAGMVSLEGEWGMDRNWEPCEWKSAWQRLKVDALAFLSDYEAVVIDYKTGKRFGNEVKHNEQTQLYLVDDPYQIMDSYLRQATRRAEWAKRFGDDSGKLEDMLKLAKEKHGATDEQIALTRRYIDSVNGHLGGDVSPQVRKISANMMVYQNLRLLPLGIFSGLIDANGIKVNGGTWGEAFRTFKRGVMESRFNYIKDLKRDDAYKLAADIGAISDAFLQHRLMNANGGMQSASPFARKANELLFRFNGMEQWGISMRVGAVEAAAGFIKRNAKGDFTPHSMRRLAELGLTPEDITVKNDKLLITPEDYKAAGFDAEAAEKASAKMVLAVNRWVDGAVMRPTAATKALWMNDPHFAIFAHMKQFAFTFHETTLRRVAHEAKYGNYDPAIALASYVPMMIAADFAKGIIQGGGSQPDWKQDWELSDYLGAGFQRAGLFGVSQVGVDIAKDFHHGGYGLSALGPTVGQLGDAVKVATGNGEFSNFALRSLPLGDFAKPAAGAMNVIGDE